MATRLDPDQDLLTAIRDREPTAAEALITAYGDRAYRLAARITGNQEDAEEAVQDAFWSVVRKVDMFRGDSAFGSWVYRIVANSARTKLRVRRAQHRECSLDEDLAIVDERAPSIQDWSSQDWSSQVENPALQSELRAVLTAALDALPEGYRTIVVLRDVEGMAPQNVSEITGLSVGAVKTRTHRARLVLRKCLGEYFADRLLPRSASPSVSPPSPRRRGVERVDAGVAAVPSGKDDRGVDGLTVTSIGLRANRALLFGVANTAISPQRAPVKPRSR